MKQLLTLALTLTLILGSVGGTYAQELTQSPPEEDILNIDSTPLDESVEPEEQAITEEAFDEEANEDIQTEQMPLMDADQAAAYAALSAEEQELVDTYFNGIVPFLAVPVSTFDELQAALVISSIDEIILQNDIPVEETLQITRDITFTSANDKQYTLKNSGASSMMMEYNADADITFNRVVLDCYNDETATRINGIYVGEYEAVITNAYIRDHAYGIVIFKGGNLTVNQGVSERTNGRTTNAFIYAYESTLTVNDCSAPGNFLADIGFTEATFNGSTTGGRLSVHNRSVAYLNDEMTLEGSGLSLTSTSTVYMRDNAKIVNSNNTSLRLSSTLIMEGNSSIDNCTTATAGGGVTLDSSSLTMRGSATISNCHAGTFGGGVSLTNGSSLQLEGRATIEYNSAETYGGGIYIDPDSTFQYFGGIVVDNTAGIDGDNIYYA